MQKTDDKTAVVEVVTDESLMGDQLAIAQRADRSIAAVSEAGSLTYIVLPATFLSVALLGGFRLNATDNSFVFLKPALVCLVFAALTLVLFFRSGLIAIDGWLERGQTGLQNAANLSVLLTLFMATVQLYNALLPEQGLPFWVIGFCFFWTIWNNLFAELEAKKLLRSLVAAFGLGFVVKYLVLANLTAAPAGSWWQRILENPGKEAFTWLLDIQSYSTGTGYIQFFTLALYMIGLFLIPRRADK